MLNPLRPLFAWALLGYAALEIFFGFLRWAEPSRSTFAARAANTDFTTLITIGFPLLAVLIATQIQPVLGTARLVTVVALAELAAVIFFGAIAFLIGMVHVVLNTNGFVSVFSYVVLGIAGLAFAALAGYACFRVLNALNPPAA
jgi:hypothetical protein